VSEPATRPLPAYPAWAREPAAWWRLSEPSNVASNLVLAAGAAVLALRLGGAGGGAGVALLACALALIGVAAVLGAMVHGLTRQLGERRWRALWRLTLWVAALVNGTLLAGIVIVELRGPAMTALVAVALVKFVVAARHAARDGDFRWVVLDSGLSLAIVAALAAAAWLEGSATAPAAPWLLGAVVVSVAAGLVQQCARAPHRHLTCNDLYHLGQLVAVYLLYRGGLLLAAR
jgi:hypothetical protein